MITLTRALKIMLDVLSDEAKRFVLSLPSEALFFCGPILDSEWGLGWPKRPLLNWSFKIFAYRDGQRSDLPFGLFVCICLLKSLTRCVSSSNVAMEHESTGEKVKERSQSPKVNSWFRLQPHVPAAPGLPHYHPLTPVPGSITCQMQVLSLQAAIATSEEPKLSGSISTPARWIRIWAHLLHFIANKSIFLVES